MRLIDLESNSIFFLPKDFVLEKKVGKIVYLCEERDELGLYLYQSGKSFLKSICDYIEKSVDINIINILMPTGFNNDLALMLSVIEKLNSRGNRSLIIDTNPCRFLYESNWDYSTKELLNNNLQISDIPYIKNGKYYYLKPFNSFRDYYENCSIYSKILDSIKTIDGVDYVFFLHYLSDYSCLGDIEKNSKSNIILTYGSKLDNLKDSLDISNVYINNFIELVNDISSNTNTKVVSSEQVWASSKVHYREFELSIYEELIRC